MNIPQYFQTPLLTHPRASTSRFLIMSSFGQYEFVEMEDGTTPSLNVDNNDQASNPDDGSSNAGDSTILTPSTLSSDDAAGLAELLRQESFVDGAKPAKRSGRKIQFATNDVEEDSSKVSPTAEGTQSGASEHEELGPRQPLDDPVHGERRLGQLLDISTLQERLLEDLQQDIDRLRDNPMAFIRGGRRRANWFDLVHFQRPVESVGDFMLIVMTFFVATVIWIWIQIMVQHYSAIVMASVCSSCRRR